MATAIMGYLDDNSYGLSDEDNDFYEIADDSDYESDFYFSKTTTALEHSTRNEEPVLAYKSFTPDDLFDKINERLDFINTIIQLPRDSIIILLRVYGWNEEKLLEEYTESTDYVLEAAGLKIPTGQVRAIQMQNSYTCSICCEYYDKTKVFKMECEHEACIGCYRRYLETTLKSPTAPTCMSCKLAINSSDITEIFGSDQFSKKHLCLSFESYINRHSQNYKWCPYTGCGNVVYSNNESTLNEMVKQHIIPEVTCNNGHKFCFYCSSEVHSPSNCKIAQFWIEKVRQESTNLNWILKNTKSCPFCGTSIEKNGGCNHMTCQSCHSEFCWICDRSWAIHTDNYVCKFQNEKKEDINTKSISKRFTDGYKMFIVHEDSSDLDLRLASTMESKILSLQKELGISWIEGQFMSDSIKTLLRGRTVLKWSYALGVFCDPSHNFTHILVQNQTMLSNAVESLSLKLQIKDPKIIINNKAEFIDAASLVNGRITALEQCCRELLAIGICKLEKI